MTIQPPRRLAFVLTQSGGGPVDVTVALVRWFAQQSGYVVRLLGPRPDRGFDLVEEHWEHMAIPGKSDVSAMRGALRQLSAFRPDVVHAEDRRSGLLGAALVTMAELRITHAQSAAGGPARPVVVHTYHGVPDDVTQEFLLGAGGQRPSPYTAATLAADAVVARRVDHTVVVADVMGGFLRDRLKVPGDRVSHLDNGLWLPPEQSVTSVENLLFVGALIERKGVRDLLEAMTVVRAAAPRVRLRIVGDGPLRPDLERQAHALGLDDCVEFLGFRGDVPALLAQADAFVLPARMEQQPLVLIEALAAGKLIVATDAGGVADMLAGLGDGARIVPTEDPAALAAALVPLLATPNAAELSAANAEKARERFSIETCGTAHARLYDRLLAVSPRA